MNTDRIDAFSDGVFAIAITLLILDIRPPYAGRGRLLHQLLELWPSYLPHAISFLLIGLVWANHHAMFGHIAHADRWLILINVLLLANVTFLPFPTAVLAAALRDGRHEKIAARLYGTTLAIGGIIFNAVGSTPPAAVGT